MKLHELHQRRLEVTVSLVENGLDRMERLLSEGPPGGSVRTVEDTLSPEERSSLLVDFGHLRSQLRRLAEQYSLQRHAVDIHQVLNAELSSAWVMIENCRPKRMKGYGVEFDPVVRATLEDNVEQLLARVLALRAKLR